MSASTWFDLAEMVCSSASLNDPAPGSSRSITNFGMVPRFRWFRVLYVPRLRIDVLAAVLVPSTYENAGHSRIGQRMHSHCPRVWVVLRSLRRSGGDEVIRERVRGGCRSCVHAELGEDVGDVAGDRLLAEEQRARDLFVGLTGRDE